MGLLDIGAQLLINRQNRKAALRDWERQNTYNHPKQQMQRLKEAGLNPNLVYGGGATTLAQPVHSPQAQAPNVESVPQMLGQYVDLQNKGLQKNNMQNALKLQEEDIKNKEAQRKNLEANTLSTLTGIDLKKLDINAKEIFNQFLPEYAELRNKALKIGNEVKVDQNEMQKLMFPHKVDEVLATIGNIKARTSKVPFEKAQIAQAIENMKTSNHYQKLNESQKHEMGNILQQSELIKQIMNQGTITKQLIETDLLRIKQQFKALGLSETVVSDIMGDIIKVMIPSAPKTVIHSKQ